MHYLPSLACWFFLLCISISSGAAEEEQEPDPTGTLDIDLVFPRNETYNPTPMMPVVFSYRNPKLISVLRPHIMYQFWEYNKFDGRGTGGQIAAPYVNTSSTDDPHFEHHFFRTPFNTEGQWKLVVHFSWFNCYKDPDRSFAYLDNNNTIRMNGTSVSVVFTTTGPSKQVDLNAATSNKNCSAPAGIAIDVRDTLRTPQHERREDYDREFCPVVPSVTKADKCDVTMGPSAASSVSAAMTSFVCAFTINKTEIPEEVDCSVLKESMAMPIVFGGTTFLAFVLGALGYLVWS
ncbi:uncharacterized protein BKA55DRAFT_559837 [Fusarium redolens]|jgi:hypothetical protein|uniref:DUF7136 domain-containing protein n=1 Tax=Fusarium redolens TaxID=48865 RepID=A0A9P9HQR6_FUSRE|nr:uncharacterized protein BKA55DRAFT_559837 [Fusarium redolens]KAH7260829.1 hypothetical protein BKA55DRAFT_559837 [Fusarium redolens]